MLLHQLGRDVLLLILSQLNMSDLCHVAATCKLLHELSKNDTIWHALTNRYFKVQFPNSALKEKAVRFLHKLPPEEGNYFASWYSYLRHKVEQSKDVTLPFCGDSIKGKRARLKTYDPEMMLLEDGLCCKKISGQSHKPTSATEPMIEGLYYWTVKVHSDAPQVYGVGQIYLGVCRASDVRGVSSLGSVSCGWSLCPYADEARNGTHEKYKHGRRLEDDDTVGIWVDMDAKKLAFYKNGKYLGVAFNNLPDVALQCGTMMLVSESITVNFCAPFPDINPYSVESGIQVK